MADSFTDFFRTATGGHGPYPFQERFAEAIELPHLLRAPTGSGKTATAVLGWLWRWHTKKPDTPRRLIYCLPMRVLVEQSEREAKRWIDNLRKHGDLKDAVNVHILMGGVDTEDWFLYPEKPAILIGTQDMLLSRALNRGYAASRFHWPIDFGLLNNDCLWVFDEPQLMGSGVSTSAQLAGLRKALGTFGPCPSVWMSATLEPGWLDTIDFRNKFPAPPHELDSSDYDPKRPLNKRMTADKTLAKLGTSFSKDADDKEVRTVAELIFKRHKEAEGTQTLVVMNTVKRATKVYEALLDLRKKYSFKEPLLVHSRFRPFERSGDRGKDGAVIRKGLNDRLQESGDEAKDRIIVATQVVEAGVDISARTLITELAPWASIVQRIGRCNRTGEDGPGRVFWIDSAANDPEKKEHRQAALPYSVGELNSARDRLNDLDGKNVSPRSLEQFRLEPTFSHTHVIRHRDLLDLFDTSSDLSGNDIDVSRFVRGDDPDTDVKVFWRVSPPNNKWNATERRRQAARREELCSVPISSFKEEFLKVGKAAYRWDFLDEEWRVFGKKNAESVVPGQVFWVTIDQGGYKPDRGWTPSAGPLPATFPLPLPLKPGIVGLEEFDGDDWSKVGWRTIAQHTDEVVAELTEVLRPIGLPGNLVALLGVAARWHDWGKIHELFQKAIGKIGRRPEAVRQWKEFGGAKPPWHPRPQKWADIVDLAKAADGFWKRYERKRFRHELASALGILRLQEREQLPPDWAQLSSDDRWLAVYLIAAHHGKVRLAIRTMPDESPIPDAPEKTRFACGVWDKDKLPSTNLGGGIQTGAVELSLAPMLIGNEASWSAHTLALRNQLGPFRLAYLETILRAADCRASAKAGTEEGGDDD